MLPGGLLTVKIKLDAKTIPALALPKNRADEICWDTELEGFGLRLRRRTDGGLLRNWVAQYRADHHTRRVTIGAVDKITPSQARDAARKLLARVELGADPQAEKAAKRRRETHTVRTTVESYLDARRSQLRPGSLRIAGIYLTGSYFKALHSMAVTAVTRADVAACIRNIVRNHSGPTASAARRALSAFFAWAIADGLLGNGANPVDGSHRPDDPTPRDHVPTAAELVAIWNACGDDDFGRIVRLLILLGSRRAEVGGMCWTELDLDAGTWALPSERSKNHRAHTITLPPAALAIIALGAAHQPRSSVWRPCRSRVHVMGARQARSRSPSWRPRETVQAARPSKGRRDPHGRHRDRAASHRGSPQPLFRPPRAASPASTTDRITNALLRRHWCAGASICSR